MLFRELEQIDEALARVSFGDFATLQALLPRREALLLQLIPLARTAEHEKALRRSRHTAAAAIRQVSLARNQIVQEMAHLTQEQRWRDSISAQLPDRSSHWSLQA